MAKVVFKEKKFNTLSNLLIKQSNEIIDRYTEMGLRLTLRQLYYRLVSANTIRNTEKSYKRLGHLLSEARLAGRVDWDAIEDRVRFPRMHNEYTGLPELLDESLERYRLDRWENQEHYVELWVEKDALAGVLMPLAMEYHIVLMVNRGYSSTSAMYECASRYRHQALLGKTKKLFYLGDHDPSGEDMVRDIEERFSMFGVPVEMDKIALTMGQVRKYSPLPQPAKESDSRYEKYVQKHGDEAWEVDALEPSLLQSLIKDKLDALVDHKKMNAVKLKEVRDKRRLKKALAASGMKEFKHYDKAHR